MIGAPGEVNREVMDAATRMRDGGPARSGLFRGSWFCRLAPFADVSEVESALEQLSAHTGGALVLRLAREPGRRESRYAQLFSGPVSVANAAIAAPAEGAALAAAEAATPGLAERVSRLEAEVAQLRAALEALRGTPAS